MESSTLFFIKQLMKKIIFILFLSLLFFSCEREPSPVPNNPSGNNDNPLPQNEQETVKDHEGNIYPIKKIGDQIWTTKNMCCNTLKDGTPIISESMSYTSFYSPVGYHTSNGNLYNLLAAEEICPDGWHLPTRQEWEKLFGTGTYAAKPLASQNGWKESNIENTPGYDPILNNSKGFDAYPTGYGMNAGYSQGKGAYFWASGRCVNQGYNEDYNGTVFSLYYNEVYTKRRDMNLDIGAAVRCIKD